MTHQLPYQKSYTVEKLKNQGKCELISQQIYSLNQKKYWHSRKEKITKKPRSGCYLQKQEKQHILRSIYIRVYYSN